MAGCNVRELENLVKRMIVLGDPQLSGTPLGPGGGADADAKSTPAPSAPAACSLKAIARDAARGAERQAIRSALEETRWNRVKAAKLLRISYRALLYKIKGLGIENRSRPAQLPLAPPPARRLFPARGEPAGEPPSSHTAPGDPRSTSAWSSP